MIRITRAGANLAALDALARQNAHLSDRGAELTARHRAHPDFLGFSTLIPL